MGLLACLLDGRGCLGWEKRSGRNVEIYQRRDKRYVRLGKSRLMGVLCTSYQLFL